MDDINDDAKLKKMFRIEVTSTAFREASKDDL